MRAGNLLARREADMNGCTLALDASNLDPGSENDPFLAETLGKTGRELGIVARQQWSDVKHCDARTEAIMGLRHLDPDRSAADDDQVLRQLAIGKNRFVCQIRDVGKPRDGRYRWLRTGRDHKAPGPDFDI